MRPTKVRVVFLDFDGVLNNTEYLLQNSTSQPGYVHERDDIDPIAVVLLNDLVTRGNAYAVVSSAWRIGRMRTQLCDILNGRGYKGKILDKTPEIKPYRRDQRGQCLAKLFKRPARIAFSQPRPEGLYRWQIVGRSARFAQTLEVRGGTLQGRCNHLQPIVENLIRPVSSGRDRVQQFRNFGRIGIGRLISLTHRHDPFSPNGGMVLKRRSGKSIAGQRRPASRQAGRLTAG